MNAILSSSSYTQLRIKWSPIVSKNFLSVSLFPAKGVILPPFILVALFSLVSAIFFVVVVVVSGFLCSSSALKNRSVGTLSSRVIWKLSSVSICSRVVHGSGVGAFLHRCSRLNGSKGVGSCILGSPTRLRDNGSLSESSLFGGQNRPRRRAVMVSLWSCVQRWSKGSFVVKLVLRLG